VITLFKCFGLLIRMKHFIYFSKSAATSGKALSQGNLMKAGRMDIVIHSLIQALFISKEYRTDTVFHLVSYGMPDPPKHIEIQIKDKNIIKKSDVATLIKKILYKCEAGKKKEIFPGCFVEKKALLPVIEELIAKGNDVFILDKRGEDLRKIKMKKEVGFIIGDHDGLPKKEMKRLKQIAVPVSVGPKMYFASQVVAVVNNELDVREI